MTFDIFELLALVFLTAVAAYGIGFGRGYEEARQLIADLDRADWLASRPWSAKEPE